MIEVKEESRCLASLAVFRELYNNNRDIYCIIGEFIKEINKHDKDLASPRQVVCILFEEK